MDNLVNRLKMWCKNRKTIRENKKLCEMYPFLIPWNRFTGEPVRKYDYSYTELDDLPDGWRKRFGLNMCRDLRTELIGDDDLNRWKIVQMKEKYGEMRLYDNGHKVGSHIPNIIARYQLISMYTCIICGENATRVTLGWISPFCDKCCPDQKWEPIGEFYKEANELE